MKNIKTYSRKYYSLKINRFYFNPITLYRSCSLPHEEFFSLDLDKFFYDLKQKHELLLVSEETENYSYS